jgi:hypothetical protein
MWRDSMLRERRMVKPTVVGVCAVVALFSVLTALRPATSVLTALLVVVMVAVASHRVLTARIASRIAVLAALAGVVMVTAVAPRAAAVGAFGMSMGAVPAGYRWDAGAAIRRLARAAAALLAACLAIAMALGVGISPGTAALGAGAALVLATTWATRASLMVAGVATGRGTRRVTERFVKAAGPRLLVPTAILGAAGLAVAVAMSPAATLLVALVIGIVVLAWRSPSIALGAAVLLFAFEGSVKILLGLDGVASPGGNRAAGAAMLDVALAAAVAGVLLRDRVRAPRAIWSAATGAERVVIGAIGAWLALSVIQIAQGGDISRGAHAFRLFQGYTLVALATLSVFAQPRLRSVAARSMLGIGLVVSLYAAVRVVIGPADVERAFALAVPTVTMYGGTFRAVGSFSSAIGLSTVLTPLAVFAFVLGLLRRDVRLLSWAVGGLALVGLIGSYSRASLFGVALGLACGLLLVLIASRMSSRRRLVSATLVVVILASTYAGLWAASQASPELRERAEGVLNPFGDESVKLRFETWRGSLEEAAGHPFGEGLGAVGSASAPNRAQLRTTDNSFLKVLVEQGALGLALFVMGMLGSVVVLARRLRAAAHVEFGPVGLAALAGYVAFLGICLAGESVEQPGKVVAWALLGVAAAHAFAGSRPGGETV